MASGKQTQEYKKIQDTYATLSSTLTNQVSPGDLGNKLFQAHLIGGDLRRAANKEVTEDAAQIDKLLAAVHNQIELNSENFYKFIKILKDYKQLKDLIKLLELDQVDSATNLTTFQQRHKGVYSKVKTYPPLAAQSQGHDVDEDKLIDETCNIQSEFNILFHKVLRSLMNKEVTVRDFVYFLKGVPGHSEKPLFDVESLGLDELPDLIAVFETAGLKAHCSWFNHSLVGDIIKEYCEDKKKLMKAHEMYCTKLQRYCKLRVKKCPIKKFGHGGKKNKEMILKVDRKWEEIQIEQLEEVMCIVARILNLNRRALHLRCVENGCVQLTLMIPSNISDEVFRAAHEQEVALKEMGVTDYHFPCQFSSDDLYLAGSESSNAPSENWKYILLLVHQEIQNNLNVSSHDLLLHLFKEKCFTQEQYEELLAFGRTPHQKVNQLLYYLLQSRNGNSLDCLILSLNSTSDYEPHRNLAAMLTAPMEVKATHPPISLEQTVCDRVDSLAAIKEKLSMLMDIHELLPLINKQQLLSVSDYCDIVQTNSQALKVDLLLKSLQKYPDGMSKLKGCLPQDTGGPFGHSELDEQPMQMKEVHLTTVTSLSQMLRRKYRERRVQLDAQKPLMHKKEILEPRLVLTAEKSSTETDDTSMRISDGSITVNYDALFRNSDCGQQFQKVVVLGEPGMGKTTFCEKLIFEWGEDTGPLTEFQLVIFVPLCMEKITFSESLNDLIAHSCPEFGDTIEEHLGDGESCLFILDGWDELPDSLSTKGSIFHDLISRKCLPSASVIVTSCPAAFSDKNKMPCIDRFVTLQGFSKGDIGGYLKSKCVSTEQSTLLLQRLSDNPVLDSVCTNPLNCVTICNLWKTGKDIPLKLTEMYTEIILNIVNQELERSFPHFSVVASLETLPDDLQPLMHKIYKLAFTGLKQNRTIFTREEIEDIFASTSSDLPFVFQSLGLLQSTLSFTTIDYSVSFHFNNLTFQQYLAARYLLTLSEPEQVAASHSYFKVPRFQKVWQFYFGLHRQKTIPEAVISKCLKSNITDCNYKLHLCCCAYEADSEVLNGKVAGNLKGKFGPYGNLSAYECLAVGHVMSRTLVSFKILLKYCHIGDRGMKEIVRSLSCQQTLKIDKLHLPCADITADGLKTMSDAFSFESLKELDLTSNKIGPSGATVLAHILRASSSLEKINFKNIGTEENGAAELIACLARHKKLKELILSGNLLGLSGTKELTKCMQGLQSLKVFRIRGVLGDASADESAIATLLDVVASHCPSLEDLDISCNLLSLAGAEAFGRVLAALKHPHNLWANRTKLTDEGMRKFSIGLSSIPNLSVQTISHLELIDNDLHAEGIFHLVEAVKAGNLPVTRLYLGENPLGPEGASELSRMLQLEHCQIRSLGLSKCNLGSKGAVTILHALSNNTSLDDINLTGNEIGKTDEMDMSTYIRQLLQPQHIHSCTPTGSNLKLFCSTLKPNTQLGYLRISDNYFTGFGIEILLSFLTVCQSLKRLWSRNCHISSDDLKHNRFQTSSELATSTEALFTHPELQKWNLEDNLIQEDATIIFHKLAETACPQLNSVFLQGNPVYSSHEEAQEFDLENILQSKISRKRSSDDLENKQAKKTHRETDTQTPGDSSKQSYYGTGGAGVVDSPFISLHQESTGFFSSTISLEEEETVQKIYAGEKPTIQQLQAFPGPDGKKIRVHEQIGTKYTDLAVFLLGDDTRVKVETFAMKHSQDPDRINLEILSNWLQGLGKQPVTWSTLVQVLRDLDLKSVANDIESGLYSC